MIHRIDRIKNLGIFRETKWPREMINFSRFNLVYGWNGSGKTTLSRLFSALAQGKSPEFNGLEYEVTTATRRWKNGESCAEKIRVFNRDYVQANVERVGGPNPIFILGEENKQLIKEIERDEAEVESRSSSLTTSNSTTKSLQDRRDHIFTDIARTVSQNVSGETTRNYRKPNAESDFNALESKTLLSDEQLALHKGTITQKQLTELDLLPDFTDLPTRLIEACNEAEGILLTRITSVRVQHLVDNPDISEWVETGIPLHQQHESKHCEFCENEVPSSRLNVLSNHFNVADANLKKRIDEQVLLVGEIQDSIRKIPIREVANLYDELQGEYSECIANTASLQRELTAQMETILVRLEDKRSRTSEQLELGIVVNATDLVDSLRSANSVIQRHNMKTQVFESQKDASREDLKRHYLSEIVDDVESIDIKITAELVHRLQIESGKDAADAITLSDLRSRITLAKATVSSSQKACAELNEMLVRFLGRDEIAFEVAEEGFTIKRDGVIATNLSEGEKTAIAFVYFIVHLRDQDFDLKNGIVVIDDPVSSLDSNSLFQAFAFLKDSVQDAKQVFVLTHNFEFMRLVKNWFFKVKPQKISAVSQMAFYMIKNKFDGTLRSAYLAPLDPLLKDYQSEYHYLFSLLLTFKEDASLEQIYLFPNVGRKVLETFLAFKVPSSENMDVKMAQLDFPDVEKSAILRFVNEHSHANRSDGVLEFDLTLTNGSQQAIKSLLALMEKVDPVHYDTMMRMCA